MVMLVKRLLLAVISIAFGVAVTFGIVLWVGTTPDEYGGAYFTLTALALAIALGVWLDKFMATEILPK
jgi:ABC-type polysaccharide/polyol phosphate export permease